MNLVRYILRVDFGYPREVSLLLLLYLLLEKWVEILPASLDKMVNFYNLRIQVVLLVLV